MIEATEGVHADKAGGGAPAGSIATIRVAIAIAHPSVVAGLKRESIAARSAAGVDGAEMLAQGVNAMLARLEAIRRVRARLKALQFSA
jgi:predicted phage tail protein